MSKRYYWLKLKDDFFSSIKIKKLRKNEDGNLLTIIYLKMQLLSVKNGGVLLFESVESSFEEELALVLDEEVTYVRQTVGFLRTQGMLEQLDDRQFLLTDAAPNIGSESESAARVRRLRCKRNAQPLHFDENVTSDIEKDIDTDIDIDTEKEGEGETPQPIADDNLSKYEQKFEDINEFRPDGRSIPQNITDSQARKLDDDTKSLFLRYQPVFEVRRLSAPEFSGGWSRCCGALCPFPDGYIRARRILLYNFSPGTIRLTDWKGRDRAAKPADERGMSAKSFGGAV